VPVIADVLLLARLGGTVNHDIEWAIGAREAADVAEVDC
jgi:hypothetical protein